MINNIKNWINTNKLATVLIVVLVIIVGKEYKNRPIPLSFMKGDGYGAIQSYGTDAPVESTGFADKRGAIGMPSPIYPVNTPTPGITDRMVITEANLSLQVDNVTDTTNTIKTKVIELGGYVVNIYLSKPEFGESANVTVRVPSKSLDDFLGFARQNAVKVVHENVSGNDITDQYVDTETRLLQLREQKARLEAILKSAVTVDEIMKVQPYITSVQDQIDRLIGQNNYSEEASKVSLVTIYLSTDELSLPYTPDMSWRPQAIFKNASRSLIMTVQKMGTAAIWLGVYSMLILPALTIVYIIYLVTKRKQRSL